MAPLQQLLEQQTQHWMPFGSASESVVSQIPAEFDAYEAEYAAIRRHVALMTWPQRGILRLTGSDVQDFLHRLVTQNINALKPGQSTRSFQLNTKGRIVSDMMIHFGEQDTWIDADRCDLPAVQEILDQRLFTEDVTIEDWSDKYACLMLHGPAASAAIEQIADSAESEEGPSSSAPAATPGTHHVLNLASQPVTVYRNDLAGVMGLTLWCQQDHAPTLWQKLLDAIGYESESANSPDAEFAEQRRQSLRGRPVGWLAFNTARIEAGSPMFHIDFGPDSLPAETGLLDQTTSFTKGCYLGQEIVARMHNLGHPAKVITGFRVKAHDLPVAGSQIFPADTPDNPIGGITSSTQSPLLGQQSIGFAVMKWGHHTPGTTTQVATDGQWHEVEITELAHMNAV